MTGAKDGEVVQTLSHLLPGISTQPGTDISLLFLYCEEPHAWVYCIWDCRWRRWSRGLKELQALAAPLWAAALHLSGGLALYHSFQLQWKGHEELSLLSSVLPRLHQPWVRWHVGMLLAGSRSPSPGQCAGWLLAPCAAPLESQLGQHRLPLLSLKEGGPRTALKLLLYLKTTFSFC